MAMHGLHSLAANICKPGRTIERETESWHVMLLAQGDSPFLIAVTQGWCVAHFMAVLMVFMTQ